jgi:sialic acid synthase
MIRDIRLIDNSMGVEDVFISDGVTQAKLKLERSIASNKKIIKGSVVSENDIQMLSPGTGFKWTDRHKVIGRIAAEDISENEIILSKHLK